MRSFIFNIYYYTVSAVTVFGALPLLLLPSRGPLSYLVHYWAKAIVWGMGTIAGIQVEVRGAKYIPPSDRPGLIAPKHQSWCDGIILMSLVRDAASIATAELGKYPFFRHILPKLGVILVEACGGGRQIERLNQGARKAFKESRPILIYPEGRLVPVGEAGPYKPGVFHMYTDLSVPVTPVATNVGLRWPGRAWHKKAGRAVIEFLPPIAPGQARDSFMHQLEARIESATRQLVREAQ